VTAAAAVTALYVMGRPPFIAAEISYLLAVYAASLSSAVARSLWVTTQVDTGSGFYSVT